MTTSSSSRNESTYGDAVCSAADHVGIPREQIDRFLGTLQMCGWHVAPISASSERGATEKPFDAAAIIERKAKTLTEEYCHGDSGPSGYVWTNKEAEWQVILLEELAEEIRNAQRL